MLFPLSGGDDHVERGVREPSTEGNPRLLTRAIDILVSGSLLVLTSPVFIIIGILIKLDSKGPVFFRQKRYGKGRRLFRMWKFRKMREDLPTQGAMLTARFDPRLTAVGRWLERTKLDELPQLINVLVGNMTLVGPRPEVPKLADGRHEELWDVVLQVKPGIVGPNQVLNRNESELYPEDCADREAFYIDRILPDKLAVDAEYARRKNLLLDAAIFFRGLWATLSGTLTRESVRTRKRQVAFLAAALTFGCLSYVLANLFRFEGAALPESVSRSFWLGFVVMVVARAAAFLLCRVHRCLHSVFTLSDAARLVYSVGVGTAFGISALMLLNVRSHSRSVYLIDAGLLSMILFAFNYGVDRFMLMREKSERRRWGLYALSLAIWSVAAGALGVLSVSVAITFYQFHLYGSPVPLGDLIKVFVAVLLSRGVLFGLLAWRIGSFRESASEIVKRAFRPIVEALIVGFFADLCFAFLLNVRNVSRFAFLLHNMFYAPMLLGLIVTLCLTRKGRTAGEAKAVDRAKPTQVMVVGEGRETALVVSALMDISREGVDIVGIVACNPRVRANSIAGVEIMGLYTDMAELLLTNHVDRVLIMRESADYGVVRRVVRACRDASVDYRMIPDMLSFLSDFASTPPGVEEDPEEAGRVFEETTAGGRI